MGRLDTLEDMIRPVLKAKPETRDDDRELALCVWYAYFGVSPWEPVESVLKNRELPSIESIGRIRRKIQQTDESLRGSKGKERIRLKAQEDYLNYV